MRIDVVNAVYLAVSSVVSEFLADPGVDVDNIDEIVYVCGTTLWDEALVIQQRFWFWDVLYLIYQR